MRSVAALFERVPVRAATSRSGGGLGAAVAFLSGKAGGERLLGTMSEVSTLFAIVSQLSTATASVRWDLWRKASSGEKKDRERVEKHAALDLWNRPNKHYTQSLFVQTFQQHCDLTGEAPWVVAKAGKLPLELWPVRPDRLEPVPSKTDFLAGYVYRAGPEPVPLGVDDVIRIMMPNPLDPYRGLGPVQSLLVDLDAARFSKQWNRNFFMNSAEPGGMVKVPNKLDDTEFEEFRMRWQEQHRGTANAHRVAILEDGAEWVDRKYTNRDMQFAELNGLSREIIREAFAFPKSMLGSVEDVNRANAEAGEVVFGRWLIVPRLERIKDALNNQLLPMYGAIGEGLEFDYVPPVPEDRAADNEALAAQTSAFAALITAGVDPDAAAAQVGMPPLEMTAKSGVTPQLAYAAVALVKGGFDSAQVLAALGLPPMDFEPPAVPGALPGQAGGAEPPDPSAPDDPAPDDPAPPDPEAP